MAKHSGSAGKAAKNDKVAPEVPPAIIPPFTAADVEREDPEASIYRSLTPTKKKTTKAIRQLTSALMNADVPASPQIARATQYTVMRLREVRDEFGLLTSVEAGRRMGSKSMGAARTRISAAKPELLVLRQGNRSLIPGYQIGDDGQIRDGARRLAHFAHEHQISDRSMVLWTCYPSVSLGGARPVDILDSDPDAAVAVASDHFLVSW